MLLRSGGEGTSWRVVGWGRVRFYLWCGVKARMVNVFIKARQDCWARCWCGVLKCAPPFTAHVLGPTIERVMMRARGRVGLSAALP